MVGRTGFGPVLTQSKCAILPLDDLPIKNHLDVMVMNSPSNKSLSRNDLP